MLDEKKCKSIVKYMNKGIIESNIDYVIEHDGFVCLAKIELDIDLDDAYSFKNLMGYLHSKTDFGAILLDENNAVMLIFRDYKIHQAKAVLQKIQRSILHLFNVDIKVVGITLIDVDDDFKILLSRLEQYYVMSKISSNKKIFYGTKYFNFYEGDSNVAILQTLFNKINILKIHNLYKGVPLVDKVAIVAYNKGDLLLKINKSKIPFYRGEEFCFLEHDLIPNIIKATILRVNPTLNTLSLCDLEFLDNSPVERSGVRIEPDRNIYATLTYEKKDICKGYIINISENSVVLHVSNQHLKQLAMANVASGYLTLKCQIPTKKSFITTIKTKATIFRMDDNDIVVTIYPSPVAKTKLRSYISMKQTEVLMDLKVKIKEASKFK